MMTDKCMVLPLHNGRFPFREDFMNDGFKSIREQEWFTVEQIDQDTFAISEYKHWEETHCYLLCGSCRALLIDTGLGVANLNHIVKQLTSLPVSAAVTHAHWDHIGGLKDFSDIAVHEAEQSWISGHFPLPLETVRKNLMAEPCEFPAGFSIQDYRIFSGIPDRILCDGDQIHLGNRNVLVIHTPGHSPGHCVFYEPERGYLYSGDLIYKGKLDAFYPTTDPVQFWNSVRKVQGLEIRRILPGHHDMSVAPDLIQKIADAFQTIHDSGQLIQGSGIYDFNEFQIHI